jgi:thioredoxin-related protein
MKKINLITLSFFFISLATSAQGVNFIENLSWEQIKTKAKTDNKYIFVDAYTTWCKPCKVMSEKTFPLEEVGDAINPRFIALKVQMNQTAADNDQIKNWYSTAKEMEKKYYVAAYPTILFFSPDGKLIHRSVGYKDGQELIDQANTAIAQYDEFNANYAEYKKGKKDSAFVMKLTRTANQIEHKELAKNIAHEYINSLDQREKYKLHNLEFIKEFTQSSTDKSFLFFRNQAKKVNAVLGENEAERMVRKIAINEEVRPYIKDDNSTDWSVIEKRVKAKYSALGLEGYYGERMIFSLDHKDTLNFGKYYALYFKTAFPRSDYHINNISWSLFEQVSDPKILEIAAQTQKYSLDHFANGDPGEMDTYANLLYKLGKKEEAIKWEQQAVSNESQRTSTANRKPDPVYTQTLDKMRMGEKTWLVPVSDDTKK